MPRRVITYPAVLDAAVRRFVVTGTVDLQLLARDLAVSRATLYRVLPGREPLLADVAWTLGERDLAEALRTARGTGVDRLVDAVVRHLQATAKAEPLRRFLQAEPSVAFRVLFLPEHGVHARFARAWSEVLAQAQDRGEVELPFSPDTTANLLVTSAAAVLYDGLLRGSPPDVVVARTALRALLTARRTIDLTLPGPRPATGRLRPASGAR